MRGGEKGVKHKTGHYPFLKPKPHLPPHVFLSDELYSTHSRVFGEQMIDKSNIA
jgi:hypothetical protein